MFDFLRYFSIIIAWNEEEVKITFENNEQNDWINNLQ